MQAVHHAIADDYRDYIIARTKEEPHCILVCSDLIVRSALLASGKGSQLQHGDWCSEPRFRKEDAQRCPICQHERCLAWCQGAPFLEGTLGELRNVQRSRETEKRKRSAPACAVALEQDRQAELLVNIACAHGR